MPTELSGPVVSGQTTWETYEIIIMISKKFGLVIKSRRFAVVLLLKNAIAL
jgi:hypothetical protein